MPTHGLAGIWGLVSVAFFAEKDILENQFSGEFGILKGGPWWFLGVQMLMVVSVTAWAACSTFLELLLVNKLLGLRMSVEEELMGADKVEHGIEEHDPNQTRAKENCNGIGRDNDALEPLEESLSGVEAAESDETLPNPENDSNSLKEPEQVI